MSCSDDTSNSKKKPLESIITKCPVNGKWCQSIVEQQKIEILLPTKIPYLKPFLVNLRVPIGDKTLIKEIQIQFSMQGMQMGVNRFNMKLIKSNRPLQLWQANVVLPMCLSGRNDWLLDVKVNGVIYQYEFTRSLGDTDNLIT